jgi:hypothetical protein
MRGRVIALWQVAFQGTTPIGWITAATSPRSGLAIGSASCFVPRSAPSPSPGASARH